MEVIYSLFISLIFTVLTVIGTIGMAMPTRKVIVGVTAVSFFGSFILIYCFGLHDLFLALV